MVAVGEVVPDAAEGAEEVVVLPRAGQDASLERLGEAYHPAAGCDGAAAVGDQSHRKVRGLCRTDGALRDERVLPGFEPFPRAEFRPAFGADLSPGTAAHECATGVKQAQGGR